jgi:hypothetical protein
MVVFRQNRPVSSLSYPQFSPVQVPVAKTRRIVECNSVYDAKVQLATIMVSGALLCGITAGDRATSAYAAETPRLTPYQRGLNLEYGLTTDNRIRKCDAGAQPNCVSTSSTTRLYAPPFLAVTAASAKDAMNDLDVALKDVTGEQSELIDSKELDSGALYRRYQVPSSLAEVDYVEILIMDDPSLGHPTVFYRSQGSQVKYVWPIQQPVGDLDAQKKRMGTLRQRLGWQLLVGNCDLLECYDY